MAFERTFLSRHIEKYFRILESIPPDGDVLMDKVHYCERFVELMIDLTAQLPTRRFFNTGQNEVKRFQIRFFGQNSSFVIGVQVT